MANAAVRRIVLVLEDGSEPAGTIPPLKAFEQPIEYAQWEDGEIWFDFYRSGRAAAPIPVGSMLQLVARRYFFDTATPPISVQATISNDNGGAMCGFFPINDSMTGAMEAAEFGYDVVYQDPAGKRWRVGVWSDFTIAPTFATPGTPVVPGTSQPPLGQGLAGIIEVVTYTIDQPADAQDFRVDLASPALTTYAVVPVPVSGETTVIKIPNGLGDRTADSFRVITEGLLPDGTVYEFFVFRTGALP